MTTPKERAAKGYKKNKEENELPGDFQIKMRTKIRIDYPVSDPIKGLLIGRTNPSTEQEERERNFKGDREKVKEFLYDVDGRTVWGILNDYTFGEVSEDLPF